MKTARNYKIGESTNKLMVQIKFATVPNSAVATIPNLKFNKKNWLSLDFDDASASALPAQNFFNTKFYTDGCGNNINYRLGLAINGAQESTGIEYTYDGTNGGQLTKASINSIIAAGGDLSDHSYYHDPVGFGANVTPLENTIKMQEFIKKVFNGYQVRSKVVPTNYEGHATAAFNQGYLYSTSTGTFDNFPPVGEYRILGDFGLVPAFGAIRREFTDTWNTSFSGLTASVDELLSKTNWFFKIGSHVIDNQTAFENFFHYVSTQANDQLLVCTAREVFEFREMKNLPITQNLVGDTLNIEIDTSTLSAKNRWKDLSFIVSGATIKSVTTNATSSSFNSSTGLVNIFKQTY